MNNRAEKSILEMARGGFLERVDYEMAKILANIMDPNTKATGKRKLTARQTVKAFLEEKLAELVENGSVYIAL